MRYIVYGAGGIGGTLGARLFDAGKDVLLIARGAHLEAIKSNGLTLIDPHGARQFAIPAAGHPQEVNFRQDDIILLCMKSQHTLDALNTLTQFIGPETPIVCCQNGVANEAMALRKFSNVYAMPVVLPATHIEPGIVLHHTVGVGGILDVGRYPHGMDQLAQAIAGDLCIANFSSEAKPDVMRFKYAKLLQNLGNALQAVCNADAESADILRLLKHEALACYEAAGIDCASRDEVQARNGKQLQMGPITGHERVGGSSLQSIMRGTGSIEVDYLNGEIVLLGRLHGIPTPANSMLQHLANQLAARRGQPGATSVNELRALIDNNGVSG